MISTVLAIKDKFTNTLNRASQGVNRVIRTMRDLDVQTIRTSPGRMFDAARNSINQSRAALEEFIRRQRQASEDAKKVKNEWSTVGSYIKTAFAAFSVRQVLNLADNMTNIRARLDMIKEDTQTVAELQDKIMESANRSAASYLTTANAVTKIGIMAKDAFKNNDELIMFAELINKQFSIAGTNAAGIDAAMLQLTQAMASGVLRGEELNSVFEQAPTIIQTVADYLNVPIGQIRAMAVKGQITAEIVKNAMLSSADEINKKFESMPLTFSQVWSLSMNALLQMFDPVIQTIGSGAQFIYDNWSKLAPMFWGLVAAISAYVAITKIQTLVTWLNVAANRAQAISMLTNPIGWVALAIGILITIIYKWIQAVGGMKIAWQIVCSALLTAWDWVKIGFMTGVYWVMDLFNLFQLSFKTMGVLIANYMGDMKADTLMIMQGMVNEAISIINSFISALNKIPGVSIDAVAAVTFGTTAQLENEAAKQARNSDLAQYKDKIDNQIADRDKKLDAMKTDAKLATAARSSEIAAAQAEKAAKDAAKQNDSKFDIPPVGNIDKVGEVGKIKDDVNIAEEDLQLMKDVAEMRYVQNYITMTPQMTMNNNISEKADINDLVTAMDNFLGNEIAMAAEGSYG